MPLLPTKVNWPLEEPRLREAFRKGEYSTRWEACTEIAARYGCSPHNVRYKLLRMGLFGTQEKSPNKQPAKGSSEALRRKAKKNVEMLLKMSEERIGDATRKISPQQINQLVATNLKVLRELGGGDAAAKQEKAETKNPDTDPNTLHVHIHQDEEPYEARHVFAPLVGGADESPGEAAPGGGSAGRPKDDGGIPTPDATDPATSKTGSGDVHGPVSELVQGPRMGSAADVVGGSDTIDHGGETQRDGSHDSAHQGEVVEADRAG